MALFKDAEEWKKVILGFFQKVQEHKEIIDQIKAVGVIRFKWEDPDCELIFDGTTDDQEKQLRWNDSETKANAQMKMKVEISHQFWCGKLNTMVAMATGKIKSSGDISKLMKMMPVLNPLFELYKEYLKANGYEKMIV